MRRSVIMMDNSPEMTELRFDGLKIAVDVYRRRVRHIYLRVLPGPRLELVMPRHCDTSIDEVLEIKRRWVQKKTAEMAGARKLVSGDRFLLRGKSYTIRTETGRNGVAINGDTATVFLGPRSRVEMVLRRFLSAKTLDYVSERAGHFCEKLGVSVGDISTRDMKKWGYCTRSGRLCFNWRLICLPSELAEYVVAHECLHLKHFDHSGRFKSALSSLLPDHRQRELGLRGFLPH